MSAAGVVFAAALAVSSPQASAPVANGAVVFAAGLQTGDGRSAGPVQVGRSQDGLPHAPGAAQTPAGEVIAEIRIHGNQVATDDEVVAISGLTVGAPFTTTTIADALAKLRASKKFDDVSVLKRFASIEDPTRISVVIIVDEGPVKLQMGKAPGDPFRVVKRGGLSNLMFAPILDGEDGYGVTFGVRVALVRVTGPTGRVSFPLSWGGTKQAGIEFDRTFSTGPITRVLAGADITRRQNPGFGVNDDRRGVWARAERSMGPWRAGVRGDWQHVSFAPREDDLTSIRGDLTFDTRVDPVMPRNAVLATAAVERIGFASGGSTVRTTLDAAGYIGVFGQTVIAIRGVRRDASRELPPYLQPLLGGWSSLRGFRAGTFVNDILTAGTLELRVPLTTALSSGHIGVSAFVDRGTVYAKDERLRDATWHTGVGGSIWLTAAVLRIELAVAHGLGAGTRVNFGGGLAF